MPSWTFALASRWRIAARERFETIASRRATVQRAKGMKRFTWIVLTNCTPGDDEAFNAWYDGVHKADLLRIPGIVGVKRAVLTDVQTMMQGENIVMANAAMIDAKYKYLAIYEIEADDPAPVLQEVVKRAKTPEMLLSPTFAEAYTVLFEDRGD